MKWSVQYDNDVGPDDDGFWEWWNVSDGHKSFRSKNREDAKWLCNILNALPDTENSVPPRTRDHFTDITELFEGWSWLIGSRKWHYIRNKKTLCKRYMILGNPKLEQGNDNSPDNCKECIKKLTKEREKTNGT